MNLILYRTCKKRDIPVQTPVYQKTGGGSLVLTRWEDEQVAAGAAASTAAPAAAFFVTPAVAPAAAPAVAPDVAPDVAPAASSTL